MLHLTRQSLVAGCRINRDATSLGLAQHIYPLISQLSTLTNHHSLVNHRSADFKSIFQQFGVFQSDDIQTAQTNLALEINSVFYEISDQLMKKFGFASTDALFKNAFLA